jgi:hypothetical protein
MLLNAPVKIKAAFTLVETLVMIAALFVVIMLTAGIVRLQWPKILDGSASAVQSETPGAS